MCISKVEILIYEAGYWDKYLRGGGSDFAKSLSNLNDSRKFENFDRRFHEAQDLKSTQIFFCVKI